LITVALSTTIGAPHNRVWRALTDASERPIWDDRVLGQVMLAADSLPSDRRRPMPKHRFALEPGRSGERIHWRYRLGGVPLVMREEVVSTEPRSRLKSRISMGSLCFDQTLTLHREDDETGPRTRLGMKIAVRNSIAIIGEVVPRLDVQKLTIEYVDTTLRQVRKHCESES
jgi:uncharacterized protein YndB with AHSA1/START domain